MLPALAMALSSGVFEELLHRGTIFRNLEDMLGSWIALLASALFFGFRHLGNADGNILGALAITIEAGLLLAALYMLTRRLWPCIGFHVAWNFTQAGVFSGAVSGAFEQPGLLTAKTRRPGTADGRHFRSGGLSRGFAGLHGRRCGDFDHGRPSGQDRSAKLAAQGLGPHHSHSIVPGGFDVTS